MNFSQNYNNINIPFNINISKPVQPFLKFIEVTVHSQITLNFNFQNIFSKNNQPQIKPYLFLNQNSIKMNINFMRLSVLSIFRRKFLNDYFPIILLNQLLQTPLKLTNFHQTNHTAARNPLVENSTQPEEKQYQLGHYFEDIKRKYYLRFFSIFRVLV